MRRATGWPRRRLNVVFPGLGATIMAIGIMVSTFGCTNGLVLAGARAYYAMARDRVFFRSAGDLNRAKVPSGALVLQGVWAAFLVLPRTFDPVARAYGNLYSNLLDYVISAALIFYILTIAGVFRLRQTRPDADRPYRTVGYPAGAGPLHRRGRRDSGGAVRVSAGDDLARAVHRPSGRTGVRALEAEELAEISQIFSLRPLRPLR